MKLQSIIDDKAKQRVRDAMARGDGSVFGKKRKANTPLVEPASGIDWTRLDLNKVEVLIQNAAGASGFDAGKRAEKKGKIIIPNAVHDRILVATDFWKKLELKVCYPAWTGTLVAYESHDQPFSEKVVFAWDVEMVLNTRQTMEINYSITLTVPKKFQGKENCVLVIEHPYFELIDSTGIGTRFEVKIRDENAIHLLENFSKADYRIQFNDRFRIPVFGKVDQKDIDHPTRELFRKNGPYVGLISRCIRSDYRDLREAVDLSNRPSYEFGVAVIDREVYESLKRGGRP